MIKSISSRLPSLNLTSLTSLSTLPRLSSKYHGKPIGAQTSGDYRDNPIPCPPYYLITKGPIDGFFVGISSLSAFMLATLCFGPLILYPLWPKHKAYMKEAAEQYGPTRYGAGLKDHL